MNDHVFICYSRKDEDFVLNLATNLKHQGVPVWLDQWNIPSGANWDRTIEKALNECDRLLLVLSPSSVESDEVQCEWRSALDAKKVIIPILHEPCGIPYRLKSIQYIDFTSRSPDDNEAIGQIMNALGTMRSTHVEPVAQPRNIPERHPNIPTREIVQSYIRAHHKPMTTMFVALAIFVILAYLQLPLSPPPETDASFPDPNLGAVIRATINKPLDVINTTDLEGLTNLDGYRSNITNLTGLEYCTNLVTLNLDGNQITDVSPLAELTDLEDLQLGNNQITDVSKLSGLTNLTNLGLNSNQISNISPLAGLTNLETLILTDNRITDVSPLFGLKNLKDLRLDHNLVGIPPLPGLTAYSYIQDIPSETRSKLVY